MTNPADPSSSQHRFTVHRNALRFPLPASDQPTYQQFRKRSSAMPFPTVDGVDDLAWEWAKDHYAERRSDRSRASERVSSILRFQVAIIAGQLALLRGADAPRWVMAVAGVSVAFMLGAVALSLLGLAFHKMVFRPRAERIESYGHGNTHPKFMAARTLEGTTLGIAYDIERIAYFAHLSLGMSFVGLVLFSIGAINL